MKYKKFDNTYVVRIEKDEEVINKITELCKNENIKLGSITGIGATDKLVIGLFDTNSKQYHKTTFVITSYSIHYTKLYDFGLRSPGAELLTHWCRQEIATHGRQGSSLSMCPFS